MHDRFGRYRVGGLRCGEHKDLYERVGALLSIGSLKVRFQRPVTEATTRFIPIREPFGGDKVVEDLAHGRALHCTKVDRAKDAAIELIEEPSITTPMGRFVTLTDTFGISEAQPVMHTLLELLG